MQHQEGKHLSHNAYHFLRRLGGLYIREGGIYPPCKTRTRAIGSCVFLNESFQAESRLLAENFEKLIKVRSAREIHTTAR